MKYCSKCGSANTDDAAFCAQCGTGMEQAPKAAEAPAEPTPSTFYSAPAAPQAPAAPEAPAASSYSTSAGSYFTNPAPAASTAQSGPVSSAAPAKNPNTLWLILNIVATVLCCCSLSGAIGIVGIVFAAMGNSSYNKGDYADSDKKAKIAMYLFIATVALGLVLYIIGIAAGVFSSLTNNFNY